MHVPNRNLKETLVHMCLASHFETMESWKAIVGQRDTYYAKKNIKLITMCGC